MTDAIFGKAVVPITCQQIADQVQTAVESGAGYWAASITDENDQFLPGHESYSEGEVYAKPFVFIVHLHEELEDGRGTRYRLDNEAVKDGLHWLGENRPDVVSDIFSEQGDAHTADTFLQACLFQEEVFG